MPHKNNGGRMLGEKERDFKTHSAVSLEELVPADNFYRQVESKLDLLFVRDLVRAYYANGLGRPSVDPVVFFKLQLIMFFESFRSERQLMEQVHLNLAMRWYLGYDLDEEVPNHSTLSKIRDRLGLAVFQRFFEQIVQLCIDAGLVWGQELHFDGTLVEANADYDKQVPRFYAQAQEHLQELFEQPTVSDMEPDRHFVDKYDGQPGEAKAQRYRRQVDYWVSPTDPDASPMGKFKLGYRTHYVVDGGKARIILGCLVTPSTVQDHTPMLDLAWWSRFRWQLPLSTAVADMRYGVGENLAGLESQGITAFIPAFRQAAAKRKQALPKSMFSYDVEQDRYICPQGKTLRYRSTLAGVRSYVAKAKDCRACPLQPQCTKNKNGRTVSHSIYKVYEDRVASYLETEAYKRAMRKRQVWIEPKFAESKVWHQGRRFRLRRLHRGKGSEAAARCNFLEPVLTDHSIRATDLNE